MSDAEQLSLKTHSLAISQYFVESIFLKALFNFNCIYAKSFAANSELITTELLRSFAFLFCCKQ